KALPVTRDTPQSQAIVRSVFQDSNQYMKDGVLLRQVVNVIDAVDFGKYEESHAFGEIYETILKDLQSAGNAGEFYTPRAVTDFMVGRLAPKLGERVADFAAGTCGFLTSALDALSPQAGTIEARDTYRRSVYGIEKSPCLTFWA
ncbi:MAG: SAM-dependent DNA methyltransferase, partial [Fretibacterium sp.]|nr:SAM-dependent DNA methyltransferase [Fretibacterium sp.]